MEVESHHHEVMVTSSISPREASRLGSAQAWLETPWNHDVVYLAVVFSICMVPSPPSGCLIWTGSIHCNKVATSGKFQESQPSVIWLSIVGPSKCASRLLRSILLLWHSSPLVQYWYLSCGFGLRLFSVVRRSLPLPRRCNHLFMHTPGWLWCWKELPTCEWW